jgi:hypothetical protein
MEIKTSLAYPQAQDGCVMRKQPVYYCLLIIGRATRLFLTRSTLKAASNSGDRSFTARSGMAFYRGERICDVRQGPGGSRWLLSDDDHNGSCCACRAALARLLVKCASSPLSTGVSSYQNYSKQLYFGGLGSRPIR